MVQHACPWVVLWFAGLRKAGKACDLLVLWNIVALASIQRFLYSPYMDFGRGRLGRILWGRRTGRLSLEAEFWRMGLLAVSASVEPNPEAG